MTEPTNYFVRQPSVLVLREKHGDRYFKTDDDAELNRAALAILRQRDEAGYWYLEPKRDDYVSVDDLATISQFEEIPEGVLAALPAATREPMQEAYAAAKRRQTRNDGAYQRDRDWWTLMKGLLAQPPETSLARTNRAGRPLCWLALQYRADGEYEGMEIEPLEVA